jgi:hypothetical protein
MKNSIITFLVICIASSVSGQSTLDATTFDWLKGTWERLDAKPGQTAYEVWSDATDGSLTGMGCILKGTDTVFVEHLKIIKQADTYYYSAEVSHNAGPVLFEMTEIGPMSFVSENPQHDFPKKITYSYDGTILTATISAGTKEIPFRFKKS